MTPRVKATPSLAIIDALDVLTGQIRKLNPDVPDNIVLVLASGKTGRGAKHGHFAPDSWNDNHHEILISSESLARGAEATLGTLIHELAHASANFTGINDTSNKGRYHNKKFKTIAEGMGIELAEAPTIGWSVTTLPDNTASVYRMGLDKLTKSLTTYRRGLNLADETTKEPKVKNKTKAMIECDCHDPVSVSIQWFERMGYVLLCEACGTTYELIEND